MPYGLIVIGIGTGGNICIIRAAQSGMKAAAVEKRATLGGTCMNMRCIPPKALPHTSKTSEEAGHSFAKMGFGVSKSKLDLNHVLAFNDEADDGNVKNVGFPMKKSKVDVVHGAGPEH